MVGINDTDRRVVAYLKIIMELRKTLLKLRKARLFGGFEGLGLRGPWRHNWRCQCERRDGHLAPA